MARVIVGLSGGVDSAVAAYLLKVAGYDVIGLTVRTWHSENGAESRCCEIGDAAQIAQTLEIPYYVVNSVGMFREWVTAPFVRDYLQGLTPNPCIACNRHVKWTGLIDAARVMRAEYVATGHYASVVRLENGRYTVRQALHPEKDQSYMLCQLTQEQLASTLLPLGALSKEEVRALADYAGLSVAEKPDSQELCFITDGNYADYIEEHAESELSGEGFFVDESGTVLGRHRGIYRYTPGQRKGLGLALGYPAYVQRLYPDRNEIVIGSEDELYSRGLICTGLNFLSIPALKPGTQLSAKVKIRYHHRAQDATLEMENPDRLRIRFTEPVRAAAPGQYAVFYDENANVIGGGVIQARSD